MCVYHRIQLSSKRKKIERQRFGHFFVIFVIALTSAIHLNCFSLLMLIIIICLPWKLVRTILI